MAGISEKGRRQAELLKLARTRVLHDQEQIAHLMARRGFEVTQASVSRDVRELGLVKLGGRYVPAAEIVGAAGATGGASGGGEAGERSAAWGVAETERPGGGRSVGGGPELGALRRRIGELITGVEPVGANLLVVRTPAGAASVAGAALDEEALPEIAGTIAGDDTLFVAVKSRAAQGRLLARLSACVKRNGDR